MKKLFFILILVPILLSAQQCHIGDSALVPIAKKTTLEIGVDLVNDGTTSTLSDIRLKENIELLQNVLSKLDQIGAYSYNYKADAEKKKQIGVIAQELEKVFPELVKIDKRGYRSVNYQGLIPVLIEALKEQQFLISQLSDRVTNQTSKLSKLSSDNEEMKADIDLIKKMLKETKTTESEKE